MPRRLPVFVSDWDTARGLAGLVIDLLSAPADAKSVLGCLWRDYMTAAFVGAFKFVPCWTPPPFTMAKERSRFRAVVRGLER